jgi:hypothetical protein
MGSLSSNLAGLTSEALGAGSAFDKNAIQKNIDIHIFLIIISNPFRIDIQEIK